MKYRPRLGSVGTSGERCSRQTRIDAVTGQYELPGMNAARPAFRVDGGDRVHAPARAVNRRGQRAGLEGDAVADRWKHGVKGGALGSRWDRGCTGCCHSTAGRLPTPREGRTLGTSRTEPSPNSGLARSIRWTEPVRRQRVVETPLEGRADRTAGDLEPAFGLEVVRFEVVVAERPAPRDATGKGRRVEMRRVKPWHVAEEVIRAAA